MRISYSNHSTGFGPRAQSHSCINLKSNQHVTAGSRQPLLMMKFEQSLLERSPFRQGRLDAMMNFSRCQGKINQGKVIRSLRIFFVGMSERNRIEANPHGNFSSFAQPLEGLDIPSATLGLLSLPDGGLSKRRQLQPELRILPASAVLPGQAYPL